jgi:uncharacterized tellurite resistance protein B-like protein
MTSSTPAAGESRRDTWTRAHDLALVYVALAYGTDSELSDTELATITDALSDWRDEFSVDEVQELMMEALTVYVEAESEEEVRDSVRALKNGLNRSEKQQALKDIVRIAEADGVMLNSERSLIAALSQEWGLKTDAEGLLNDSPVDHEVSEDWSLLHDVGLVYLVVAHSTDNELSGNEIKALLSRLADWREGMTEEDARSIVRTALERYAEGPDTELLQRVVLSIRQNLPVIQRLAVLDDLVYIAEADGQINDNEANMIGTLANAWGLGIRLNGRADQTSPE